MIKIKRTYYKNYTSGILTIGDELSTFNIQPSTPIHTLELPYINNQQNISCIPTGIYKLVKHISPKFNSCFLIKNVKNRKDILIHTGNSTKDTQGCILVGFKKRDNVIFESRKALNYLLKTLPNEIELIIS